MSETRTVDVPRGKEAQRTPPCFNENFRDLLTELLRWRRDVRRFLSDPVADDVIDDLLAHATLAPSVGHSQPWRFVAVEAAATRQAVVADFTACNQAALAGYDGKQAELYAGLKLSGLCEAPVQLAIFCDMETDVGHGLGRKTMPETLTYSVVAAIQNLVLAARARGLGVGWVSILDPCRITDLLNVPAAWRLVAYLCIGWPQEEHLEPELERLGWQERLPHPGILHRR
jgi:5,6-dimethylbenzimidazole synthase